MIILLLSLLLLLFPFGQPPRDSNMLFNLTLTRFYVKYDNPHFVNEEIRLRETR